MAEELFFAVKYFLTLFLPRPMMIIYLFQLFFLMN